MKTETYKDGPVSHCYSDAMVTLAKREVLSFLASVKSAKPGDLEDEFAAPWSFNLSRWRATPHFPALARLVSEGKVVWGIDPKTDYYHYALPGKLPKRIKAK